MRSFAFTLCLLALSSCRPELPDGVFVCASDADCPEQFVCLGAGGAGRCIRGLRQDPIDAADAGMDAATGDRTDTVMSGGQPDSSMSGASPGSNTGTTRRDGGTATMSTAGPDAGGAMTPDEPAPDCIDDGDCSASNACAPQRCEDGRCTTAPVAEGMPLTAAEQLLGDCQQLVCDGQGGVIAQPQADDLPPEDGNACLKRACADGQADRSALPDGERCNDTGQCQGGTCSVCQGGGDCTQPTDCTVHEIACVGGKPECTDTGRPLDGKACATGRVCAAGSCVSCVLGATCGDSAPCQRNRITSCATGPVCSSEPMTGTSCGRERVCAAGSCVYACPTSRCGDAANCMSGRWDCNDGTRPPTCVTAQVEDGAACGDNGRCSAGACTHTALVNGNFSAGFRGWELTGDAEQFLIGAEPGLWDGRFMSTWINASDGNGDIARGSVSQRFSVPNDALALRFLVTGGHAHVRLRNEAGNVLNDVTGADSNDLRIPVSWDLTAHRGRTLILSIDDELDTGGWAFVAVLGFDVIRELDAPLRNPQLSAGLAGWTLTDDAQYFQLWEDSNRIRIVGDNMMEEAPEYGRRFSVSSYVYDTSAPRQSDAATGVVSQSFRVPMDATAVRFNIHGGRLGRVELREGSNPLYVATPNDDNNVKLPISWDLVAHRGKTVELAIIDDRGDVGWSFISSTGFDIITSYNGP